MMNELTIVERSPANEVSFGQKAAKALMDIVREKRLARKFGGEQEHIYVEGWQILAQFAGLSAVIQDAEPIEIDGIKGAKATVKLIRDDNGMVLGAAVAYCMRDEPNWRNKPWFQLASMAQTRAESKAIRMKLGWVARLAGYSGTPAEEMEGITETFKTESPKGKGKGDKRSSPHGAYNVSEAEDRQPSAPQKPTRTIGERKDLFLTAIEPLGYSKTDMEQWLDIKFEDWSETEMAKLTDWYKQEKTNQEKS